MLNDTFVGSANASTYCTGIRNRNLPEECLLDKVAGNDDKTSLEIECGGLFDPSLSPNFTILKPIEFSDHGDALSQSYAAPGSLILGGYDKSRVGGQFVEFELAAAAVDCPLPITVTGIKWANQKIMNSSDAFTACVSPNSGDLQFPDNVIANLIENTPSKYSFKSFPEKAPRDPIQDLRNPILPLHVAGIKNVDYNDAANLKAWALDNNGRVSLTLEIKGSHNKHLVVDIPYQQLLQRKYTTTEDGFLIPDSKTTSYRYIFTTSYRYNNDSSPPIFGLPFLSSAYLTVNHENSTFSLAPVATTTPSNIVPIPIKHTSCNNYSYGPAAPGPSGDPNFKLDRNYNYKPTPTKAVIAVSIVTPTAALAIICGYLVWKRSRKPRLSFTPDIPARDLGLEADSHERYESGGSFIYLPDGGEILQADGNPIHHMDDDFGNSAEPKPPTV
ncbi:hypothetical protein TWF696_007287 [Orbilia brochopaga]|uniref:Peptidase A1 domain-containing protein n=1 Tax=Orbilia brochopaga TaxID=3140254 RepID=A0AAV9URI6_9PEZI